MKHLKTVVTILVVVAAMATVWSLVIAPYLARRKGSGGTVSYLKPVSA